MLAQRQADATITAIDIDAEAVNQAQENIQDSPWKERITAVLQDLKTYRPQELFDTIVCNPPYFMDSLKCPDSQRNTARHTDTLDMHTLLYQTSLLLTPEGRFSINDKAVLPAEQTNTLIESAGRVGLYPSRHTAVITRPGLAPKRTLMEFTRQKEAFQTEELVIELERHVYSEAYIALTKDFYLKM